MGFQLSWKIMLWKCCTQYGSKSGKLGSGRRTRKGQFSFQSQRKGMLKNAQTTAQLHSSHMIVKLCSNSTSQASAVHEPWTFRCSSWFYKRQRNQRSNCQYLLDRRKSARIPEKHLLRLYWLCQSLWLCGSQQTMENSERDENTRPPDLPPEKSVCRSRSNS